MRGYKTLLYLQRSFSLTFSSINLYFPIALTLFLSAILSCIHLFSPSSHFSISQFLSTFVPLHPKCYATDIQMMMPCIWCLNTIIPHHPAHLPPPSSLDDVPLFAGNSSIQSYLLASQVSQWHSPPMRGSAFSSSEPSNLLSSSSSTTTTTSSTPLFLELFSPFLSCFPFLYSPNSCSMLQWCRGKSGGESRWNWNAKTSV